MDTKKVYSPNKNKNFYSINEILNKIFFTFKKKRKIFFELFYLLFTLKIYHKISAKILNLIIKLFGYKFYNHSSILRLFFFSSIRGMSIDTIFSIREKIFNNIEINDKLIPDSKYKDIIIEIRKNGFCDISNLFNFNNQEIDKLIKYFHTHKLYNGHDPLQSDLRKMSYDQINQKIDHEIFGKGYFSYDVETSLGNELISSLFNSIELKKIANYYCGFDTQPYTLSTMLNIKKNIEHPVTKFHRDTDDFITLSYFIYWTKTSKNNGATKYIVGSHRDKFADTKNEKILELKPGSIIAGDWMGLHSGNNKMEDNERLITMIRFGKKINQSYMQTKSYYFF